MRKNMKRFLALFVAVLTVLSMAVMVHADDTNYTLKINKGNDASTDTYSVYQIATFDVEDDGNGGKVYTNINYNSDLSEKTIKDIKTAWGTEGVTNDDKTMQDLANTLATAASSLTATAENVTDGAVTLTQTGYYLIVETAHTSNDNKLQTRAILVCVDGTGTENSNTVNVNLKNSDATITKKIVLEKNNHVGTANTGDLVDTNVAAVGDTVTYKLTSQIPNYPSNTTNVVYKITDEICNGLETPTVTSITIKAATAEATAVEMLETANAGNWITVSGKVTTIQIPYDTIKNYYGGDVVVTMTTKVTDSAVTGESGNPNSVQLTYSRKSDGSDEYTTKPDTVITYIGELNIKKVDENNNGLAGAEFAIYTATDHEVTAPTSNETVAVDQTIYLDANGDKVTSETAGATPYYYFSYGTTGNDGTLKVTGMDKEVCYAIEQKAPTGYNLDATPVKIPVTVAAKTDGLTLETTGDPVDETEQDSLKLANTDAANYKVTWKSDGADGKSITNIKGTTLPGTGGIGTTIFTFGGLALVILAAGMFVVYMKKQKNQ